VTSEDVGRKQCGAGWERLWGGSGQDFSNSWGCWAALKFAGTGRERTKNFNPHRTLIPTSHNANRAVRNITMLHNTRLRGALEFDHVLTK